MGLHETDRDELCSKRQYTFRLRRWGYFKNSSQATLDPGSTAESPPESHQFESTDTGFNDSDRRNGDGEGTTVPIGGPEGAVSRQKAE
jgi:hypothetical protein